MNDSGHDVAAATSWFEQWSLYRSIVDHDCMHHRAIAAAIRTALDNVAGSITVLDLGCGDGDPALRALAGVPVAAYTGVDASAAALEEARRRLADAPFPWTLVTADVHRLPGTTRAEYLDAYIDGMRRWPALTPAGFASTCRHVRDRDYPEPEAFTLAAAAAAGFRGAGPLLFADPSGFHRLYRFAV